MKTVGVIGCGNISSIYLENLTRKFNNVKVAAVADLDLERAKLQANKYGIDKFGTANDILSDSSIDIILNLTTPPVHYRICMDALNAGKHVYVEKPLSIELAHGKEIIDTANAKNLYVGCAPDTVMGGGIQTCVKLLKEGEIGDPVAATAFMCCHGHESWHPDPEFYYKKGGGPMFDMGPYYLTALVSMLGAVKKVSAMTNISFKTRTITAENKFGQIIDVDIPTHITGVMEFHRGTRVTVIMSFDIYDHNLPCIEVYGSEGTISVPDPNTFGGPVKFKKYNESEWKETALCSEYTENFRGLGLSEMADAIETGTEHYANGRVAYHILEIMHAFHRSSDEGREVIIESNI